MHLVVPPSAWLFECRGTSRIPTAGERPRRPERPWRSPSISRGTLEGGADHRDDDFGVFHTRYVCHGLFCQIESGTQKWATLPSRSRLGSKFDFGRSITDIQMSVVLAECESRFFVPVIYGNRTLTKA